MHSPAKRALPDVWLMLTHDTCILRLNLLEG